MGVVGYSTARAESNIYRGETGIGYEARYGKSRTLTNLLNHYNTDWPGHRERYTEPWRAPAARKAKVSTVTALYPRLHEKL